MSAAATTPAAVPPPVAGRLDEFSDRLSPMLVKELRQGLRAKTFVILFLALQALLAVVLLSAIGASSDGDSGITVSKVIFFFFSLAALIAQPLRGVGALHQEIKGQTIDLMVLTRLGAWRIVLGKWVAIVSQTALLLTAITPYLILRYFFGRMDLFAELLLLLLVFFASAVFTALTVGLSAVSSILVRGLLPLGLAIFLGSGIFEIIFDRNDLQQLIQVCTLQEKNSGWGVLLMLLVGGYLAWIALALGASMIAPMAENHSTSRRLVALGTMAVLGVLGWASEIPREGMAALLMLVGVPAVAIALNEPLQLLPPICRPFVRFGAMGKLAGRFLYPGWPSGVLFTGLMIAATTALLFSRPDAAYPYSGRQNQFLIVAMIVTIGTLLLPAIIVRIFSRKIRASLGFYILFGVVLVFGAIALAMIAEETDMNYDWWMWWFAWIPPVQMNLMDLVQRQHYQTSGGYGISAPDYSAVMMTGIATSTAYYLILLIAAFRGFPEIRSVEQAAENPTATEP